jgi:hypothetical protein
MVSVPIELPGESVPLMVAEGSVPLPPGGSARIYGQQARRRDRSVDDQRAGIHRRRAGIGVGPGQGQGAGAGLDQRTWTGRAAAARIEIGDDAADLGRKVVAADRQCVEAPDKIRAGARYRSSADLPIAVWAARLGKVDHGARRGDELRIAAIAAVQEHRLRARIVDDRRVPGRALVEECDAAVRIRGIVGDDRIARRAVIVEFDNAEIVVGDNGAVGRGPVGKTQKPIAVVGDGGGTGGALVEEVGGGGKDSTVVYDPCVAGGAAIIEPYLCQVCDGRIRGGTEGIESDLAEALVGYQRSARTAAVAKFEKIKIGLCT